MTAQVALTGVGKISHGVLPGLLSRTLPEIPYFKVFGPVESVHGNTLVFYSPFRKKMCGKLSEAAVILWHVWGQESHTAQVTVKDR